MYSNHLNFPFKELPFIGTLELDFLLNLPTELVKNPVHLPLYVVGSHLKAELKSLLLPHRMYWKV